MKKSIQITIPEPCHKDWNQMTPTQKGKFCNSCAKEVIDFTNTSDEKLVKLVHAGASICGRFKATQLNRELTLERKSKYSIANHAASLLLPLAIWSTTEISAQNKPPEVKTYSSLGIGSQQIQGEIKATSAPKASVIKISGVVTNKSGHPMPGVRVFIDGTSNETHTDFDGNYSLEVSVGQFVVFRYVDFVDAKHLIHQHTTNIAVELQEIPTRKSQEVIMGKIAIPRDSTHSMHHSSQNYNGGLSAKEKLAKQNNIEFIRIKKEQKKVARLERKQQRKNKQ